MVIEIALGIVLAVVILAFLPEILAFGYIAVAVAIALAIVAGTAFFLVTEPQARSTVLWIAGTAAALVAFFKAPKFLLNLANEFKEFRQGLRFSDQERKQRDARNRVVEQLQADLESTTQWQFREQLESAKRLARADDRGAKQGQETETPPRS